MLAGRIVVALLLVALPACSPGGGTSNHPADGAAGGGPGAADAGDAARRADGTGGTGGSGATDGGAPMTPTAACQAAIAAQCQRHLACQSYPLADCTVFANLCPDYYFNDASNRTVAGIAACLSQIAALTCTDVTMGLLPSCFVEGQRSGGAGCAYPSQCQTGVCSGGDLVTKCGACAPPAGSGQPCGASVGPGVCPNGEFCNQQTLVCTAVTTIVHAAAGQPCDLTASPTVGCTGDLLCVAATSGGGKVCTPAPGLGQPCASDGISATICAPGTTCTASGTGSTCQVAQPCGAASCDDGSYCQAGDAGMSCVPRPAVGQRCADLAAGGLGPCVAPIACSTVTGTCLAPVAAGDACDTTNVCSDYLACTGGACKALGSASCPAGGGDAGAD